MSGLGVFIFILVITALAWYATVRTKKEADVVSAGSTNKKRRKKKNWILPIIIAIIITITTIAGGVFFLVIVWLLWLDPKPYSKTIPFPSDADKKTAKRIYTWLLFSPFITVPVFVILAINLSQRVATNERVLSALIPLIFHTILLFGFNSKSSFVYRHAQQAIFLIALRAGLAALAINIGSSPEDGLGLFILGNGSLWLFGSLWGRNQVIHGECWWAKQKGETIVHTIEQLERLSPQENIEHSIQFLKSYQNDAAVNHALVAFRFGDSEIRKQAVDILDKLGKVEMF